MIHGMLGLNEKYCELYRGAHYPACMRRQPLGKRDIESKEIHKMLKRRVIEPFRSLWSYGMHRFCVDYHVLNSMTKKDA